MPVLSSDSISYICPTDNYKLIDIYDPSYDNNDITKLPDDFESLSNDQQTILKSRNLMLLDLLNKLTEKRRLKIMDLIQSSNSSDNDEVIILYCPNCKKIFDSLDILNDDTYSHSRSNIPTKRLQHKIISNDLESIDNATFSEFETGNNTRSVITSNLNTLENNDNFITNTKFYNSINKIHKNPLVVKAIKQVVDKFNEENVNYSIEMSES